MRLLWTYILQATRSMTHRRQQTALSLVGLTVGLVCFTFSINWLWYETHYDSFRPGYRDLYAVYSDDEGRHDFLFDGPTVDWLHDSVPGIRQASWMKSTTVKAASDDNSRDADGLLSWGLIVHPEYPEMMGIRLLHGDAKTALQRRDAIVLPRGTALKLFGREDVVGQTLMLTVGGIDQQTFYVTGVMEDQPTTKHSLALNGPLFSVEGDKERHNQGYRTRWAVFRTDKPEVVRRALQSKDLKCVPMRLANALFDKEGYWDALERPIQFAGLSLLLLISSLFNYIALLTSHWMGRRREYVLRLSLGGTWRSNMGWLYAEVGLMLLMVALLSLPAMEFLTILSGMPDACSTMLTTFGCVLPAFVAATLLAALYPLWYIHRISRRASLRDGRPLLLAIQIAIGAVMLFVFAGMFGQYRYMTRGDMGFRTERVLRLYTYTYPKSAIAALLDQLDARGQGCVEEAVMMSSSIFQSQGFNGTVLKSDTLSDEEITIQLSNLSPAALRFFDIKPVEGELFTQAERNGVKQVLVNKDLARKFPPGRVKPGARLHDEVMHFDYEVCGIIDLSPRRLTETDFTPWVYLYTDDRLGAEQPESCMLYNLDAGDSPDRGGHEVMFLRYRPGKKDEAIALVRSILSELQVPEEQINISAMDEYMAGLYTDEQKQLHLFSIIAASAVLVLLFGVYSFVAFVLRSHRKSIAVRRVFGATKGAIYKKYLRTYVLLTVAACAAAFPLARYLCGLWLQSFRQSVQMGWTHFLLIVLTLSGGVALIVFICLRRTLSENPADVIKEE